MLDPILQPVSRDQIVKLAEGRLGAAERRQTVRCLVAQAARNQGTVVDPYPPVAEASYDLPLKRAFERACRLHARLGGEAPDDVFEALAPVVAAGYSTSEPSGRRA
ncbi:MAG TPA: hypothetical protein VF173_36755 [Thermoanaerobaculia bacterium]|nr:hypothetical protein [Thermoanaerobaculia bacterium]